MSHGKAHQEKIANVDFPHVLLDSFIEAFILGYPFSLPLTLPIHRFIGARIMVGWLARVRHGKAQRGWGCAPCVIKAAANEKAEGKSARAL